MELCDLQTAEVLNQNYKTMPQGERLSKGQRQIVIWAAFLLTFLFISVFAHIYNRFPYDLTLALHIQAFDNSVIKQTMIIISLIGGGLIATILLLVWALLFWVKNKRNESLLLIGAWILSSADKLSKLLVDRPRPSPELVSVIEINNSGSFPSGHSTFAIIFFGALFYLSSIYIVNSSLRISAQIVAVAFILLTGVSRIYLGTHWPSDVLGGYLQGGCILGILIILHKRYRRVTN